MRARKWNFHNVIFFCSRRCRLAGNHLPGMSTGISARSGAENESVHFHARRFDLPQGRGGPGDVHYSGWYFRSDKVRLQVCKYYSQYLYELNLGAAWKGGNKFVQLSKSSKRKGLPTVFSRLLRSLNELSRKCCRSGPDNTLFDMSVFKGASTEYGML